MQQETAGEIMSVLVCISASPSNQRVIRSATRFAQGSRQSITALYVDDGKTGEERAAAIRNLELAESLGASGQIVNGRDVLGTIMDYARDNAVTDLFIGYSGPSQGPYLRHLPVYRLVHNLPEVDIHIIPDSITGLKPSGLESGSKEGLYLKDVLILVTVMGLATALSYLFDRSTFSNSNITKKTNSHFPGMTPMPRRIKKNTNERMSVMRNDMRDMGKIMRLFLLYSLRRCFCCGVS